MYRILIMSTILYLNGCSLFGLNNNGDARGDSSALVYEDFFQEDFFQTAQGEDYYTEENEETLDPHNMDVVEPYGMVESYDMVDPNVVEMEYVEATSSPEIALNTAVNEAKPTPMNQYDTASNTTSQKQEELSPQALIYLSSINDNPIADPVDASDSDYFGDNRLPVKAMMSDENAIHGNAIHNDELVDPYPSDIFEYAQKEQDVNFEVKNAESLKSKLDRFLSSNGYKLIWDSDFDVFFQNNMEYTGDDIFTILKSLSNDISATGVDIHINVYTGNNVVLVYSVRS